MRPEEESELPPRARVLIDRRDTHRLIPTKHAPSVLENLGLPQEVVQNLSEIDALTNQRVIAERGGDTGINPYELIFGVREAKIIDAAFSHRSDYGCRFNGSQRGAWYAGFTLETSAHEVAYHKARFLRNVRSEGPQRFDYQDFETDFRGEFDALTKEECGSCLQPEPIPQCYAPSQALASILLEQGSLGLLYPSTRDPKNGMCLVCFRPALVANTRRAFAYRMTIHAGHRFDPAQNMEQLAANESR
jgi:hypothetical protein